MVFSTLFPVARNRRDATTIEVFATKTFIRVTRMPVYVPLSFSSSKVPGLECLVLNQTSADVRNKLLSTKNHCKQLLR